MPRRRKRSVLVLGSTGSVGRSALEVIRAHPGLFEVAGLAARGSVETLVAQVREFRPRAAALADPGAAREARARLRGTRVDLREGTEGILSLFGDPGAEAALVGISGAAGIASTAEAVRRGMRVALANKESLVVAGPALMAAARRSGAAILPVDSEHSAVAQCLLAGRREEVRRILLTASGGALRDWPLGRLASARPEDALAHPNWRMGRRITVDSATLLNKALEVVEAVHLFGVGPDMVEVVLHRQSVVHSMVEFRDGSVMAQLGKPDMRLPILRALAHPDRPDWPEFRLDPVDLARLDFSVPDPERYPGLALGFRAAREGGLAGAVLNAADERAVELFLEGVVPFPSIARLVESALGAVPAPPRKGASLAAFLEAAAAADRAARAAVDRAAPAAGRKAC
jgi:1-deoxy-D-xylulose-5-phosphate reductoisomerase